MSILQIKYMKDTRTKQDLSTFEILVDGQVYIYILQNSAGKIKVGITTNILQRLQSLSGSNGQGNIIEKCYLSPATYLKTIEGIMHTRMSKYRIPNTEWFYYDEDPSGDIMFDSAIELIEKLFNSKSYEVCNNLRKEFISKKSKF